MAAGFEDEEFSKELRDLLRGNEKALTALKKALGNLTTAITRNRRLNEQGEAADGGGKGGRGGGGGSGHGGGGRGRGGGSSRPPRDPDATPTKDSRLANIISDALEESIDRLGEVVGTQMRTALEIHGMGSAAHGAAAGAAGGGGGHGGSGQSTADMIQQSRLTERTLRSVQDNFKSFFTDITEETAKRTENTINSIIQNVVRSVSRFTSGGYALDQIQNRWEKNMDSSARNLGGIMDGLAQDFNSISTGAMGFNETIEAIKRDLQDGGHAYAIYQGNFQDFGKDLKTLRGNLNNIHIDRQLGYEEQDSYLAQLYEQQVGMGISDKLNSQFVRDISAKQLGLYQQMAKNTGLTVEELIKANQQNQAIKDVQQMVARGFLDAKSAANIEQGMAGMSPQQTEAYLKAVHIDELIKNIGIYGADRAAQVTAGAHGYEGLRNQRLMQVFIDEIKGTLSPEQMRTQLAVEARRMLQERRGYGSADLVLDPDLDAYNLNIAGAQTNKLNQDANPDESTGVLAGLARSIHEFLADNPWIKAGGTVLSGISGLITVMGQLKNAVQANTVAQGVNAVGGLGKIGGFFGKFGGWLGKLVGFGGGAAATTAGAAEAATLYQTGGMAASGLGTTAATAGGLTLGGIAAASLAAVGGLAGIAFGVFKILQGKNHGDFLGGGAGGKGIGNSRALGYGSAILSGAGAGAIIGSIVPVVGTALGAIVGAAVGLLSALVADNWDHIKKWVIDSAKSIGGMLFGLWNTLFNGFRIPLDTLKLGFDSVFHPDKIDQDVKTMLGHGQDAFRSLVTANANAGSLLTMNRNHAQVDTLNNLFRSRDDMLNRLKADKGPDVVNGYTHKQLIDALTRTHQINQQMLDALVAIGRNTKASPVYNSVS